MLLHNAHPLAHEAYAELRQLAHAIVNGRRWTRQTTEVLHDALMKRAQSSRAFEFESKQHFLAEMTLVLRSEVADAYKARTRLKRDAGKTVRLDDAPPVRYHPRIAEGIDAARAFDLIRDGASHDADLLMLVEHSLAGLRSTELARLHGISHAAVRKRLSRGRARARVLLERAGHQPESL